MVSTEAFFENIKSEIQLELNNAKRTILLAVAWFTDKDLFELLVQKAKANLTVQLVIFDDEINFGTYGLPFSELVTANGKFFAKKENLMHNKFCIIDDKTIITGSYNWTNKANAVNNENIVVIKDDIELIRSYTKEFYSLCGFEDDPAVNNVALTKTIKRLKIIQSLIELNETEDIEIHIQRLAKENFGSTISEIINDLTNKQFYRAVEKIIRFVNQYNAVAIYTDPGIAALQAEINLLTYQIIALDNEIGEVERQIADFNHQMHVRLGDLMGEVFEAKKLYYFHHRLQNKGSEEAYQRTKAQQEQFTKDREHEEEKATLQISEEEQLEIKKAYRTASLLCHPDKFENEAPEVKRKAEELFKELTSANERNDVKAVEQILKQLKAGFLNVKLTKQNDKELLLLQREELQQKYKITTDLLAGYQSSEIIRLLKQTENLEQYFSQKEADLNKELNYWQNQVETLITQNRL